MLSLYNKIKNKICNFIDCSDKNKIFTYLKSLLLILIFSELYFYPFDTVFRFSVGIIILNITILLYKNLSSLKLALTSGILIIIVRTFISYIFLGETLDFAINSNLPTISFYIFYAILHNLFSKKISDYNSFIIMYIFATIDIVSNTCETFIRGNIDYNVLKAIVFVGIIRGTSSYLFYILLKSNELYIKNIEHQKRYSQLNILVSNIQSDLFYLQKSKSDIEIVMKNSYELYNELGFDDYLSSKALSISRDVHEIKKDYVRVLAGFNDFIDSFEQKDSMSLGDAFSIIYDNTYRLIQTRHDDYTITFSVETKDTFILKNYYALFTILNNLIINAIEATSSNSIIKLNQSSDENYVIFSVYDNASGISEDVNEFIFKPGFTTKFDNKSGKASTGIGLSHVKSTLSSLGGEISLDTKENVYTCFEIKIPKNNIVGD